MSYQPPSDAELIEILTNATIVAVLGASSDTSKPSNGVFRYLLGVGYDVVPVNPKEASVLGVRACPTLADLRGDGDGGDDGVQIDIVDVFRRSEATPEIAREAVAAGAKVLWLQLGVFSEEAAEIARAGGLTVVMDRCMKLEHVRLGIPPRAS